MSDFENYVIANTSNTLQLEPGKSFVWCSGLGGTLFFSFLIRQQHDHIDQQIGNRRERS